MLGNGLYAAGHYEEASSVIEADLATMRRLGVTGDCILTIQSNLANTYHQLGQPEHALRLKRDVYSGSLRLNGEENTFTFIAANNYAASLIFLRRFKEAKSLLRRTTPVAQRVLGASAEVTLKMRFNHAKALYKDGGAMLDDLREAVITLEETERIARRVFGGANPLIGDIEATLRNSRATLAARETPSPPSETV